VGRFYFLKRDNPDADLFGFDAHLICCDALLVFFEGKATAIAGAERRGSRACHGARTERRIVNGK
jgi:hypothetical protein